MKKIYYLSSCDTCKRILKALEPLEGVDLQDIKTNPITKAQLEQLHDGVGSYEGLFSKRARMYKERNLKEKALGENDYRDLILEHYTFLKRPVMVFEVEIFVGNSKKTVEAAIEKLHP